MHRGADNRRECAVPDPAVPLLGVSDRSVEEHGRKVAQRALRRRVQGVLQKGEPLYPVVHDYEGINWTIIVEVIFEEMDDFVESIKSII